jgi:nitroreductase
MQTIDALLQRFSARSLTEPAPDDAAIGLIVESATRAPDHGRLRPWRFIVIKSEARERFGDVLADHLRRTREGVTEEALAKERRKAFRAPLIIVVAAIISPDGKIPQIEQVLSAGAAAQNMLLAAQALGFNAVLYMGTDVGPGSLPRPAWQDFVRNWGL